jgi:hypothetical protein
MSNYDQNAALPGISGAGAVAANADMRAYMPSVYSYIAAGVGLTGLVAMLTYQFTGPALPQSPPLWVFMVAPLALTLLISSRINTPSAEAVRRLFILYGALVRLSLSTSFHAYSGSSITRVFFISAATFGGLSIWGYTTRRDLSGFGMFLIIGVFGIVVASLVKLFLRSSRLDWMSSIIGVGVFAGLTAYDTQRIRGCTSVAMRPLRGSQGWDGRAVAIPQLHQPVYELLRLMGGRRQRMNDTAWIYPPAAPYPA